MKAISPAFKSLLDRLKWMFSQRKYIFITSWSGISHSALQQLPEEKDTPPHATPLFIFHFKIMFGVHNYDTH